MNRDLIIIGCNVLLILIQLVVLIRYIKSGNDLSYLLSICGFFWGVLFYFFFGFPLDEGTARQEEIPVLEIGFVTSAILAGISLFSAVFSFLRKKRS